MNCKGMTRVDMFVTPKDVDETVIYLSFTISEGLNTAFGEA